MNIIELVVNDSAVNKSSWKMIEMVWYCFVLAFLNCSVTDMKHSLSRDWRTYRRAMRLVISTTLTLLLLLLYGHMLLPHWKLLFSVLFIKNLQVTYKSGSIVRGPFGAIMYVPGDGITQPYDQSIFCRFLYRYYIYSFSKMYFKHADIHVKRSSVLLQKKRWTCWAKVITTFYHFFLSIFL